MTFVTKWIKTGRVHDFVFLDRETIATASGNHVIFYNLSTKEVTIEYFNGPERGEGACCLASHSGVPIFCTSERRCNPRIFVHTYPEIRKISVCEPNERFNSYVSCCFSGTEYILSLTCVPNFQLIVWLWRTGEKMGFIDTKLVDHSQVIESSLCAPYFTYQFAPTLGKLQTYEIYAYSKQVIMIRNNVQSVKNKIVCVCWTNTGALMLCDKFRNVYIVSGDGKKSQLVLSGQIFIAEIVKNPILILPYYTGFLMVNDDSKLTFYNKLFLENNIETWKEAWSLDCASHPLKIAQARHKDSVLIYCENGLVYELKFSSSGEPSLEEILNDCRKFEHICTLKPDEQNIVLLDDSNNLSILNIYNGLILDNHIINREDKVLCLATHPCVPLIALGASSGKCMCFMFSEKNLKLFYSNHLQRRPLNRIKFSKNGTVLGISSEDSNYIFLLQTNVNKDITVFFYLNFKESIIDFLIYDDDDKKTLQLIVLMKNNPKENVSNCVKIFTIEKWKNLFDKSYEVFFDSCYQSLKYGSNNSCDFIGSPHLSNRLHFFEFQNDYDALVMTDAIASGHQIRKFEIYTSNGCLITSGYDGSIILRNICDLSKLESLFLVHHYQEYGAKNTVISGCGKMLASLGRNGSLVGLEIEGSERITDKKSKKVKGIDFSTWECKKTTEFASLNNLTWLEKEEIRIKQDEIDSVKDERRQLLADLNSLKLKIKTLLDLNEKKSIEAQLPVAAFDLCEDKRKEKIEYELMKREEENNRIRERIHCMEKIIGYMMKNFWNAMDTHKCTLIAFNSKIQIDNFCLYQTDKFETDDYFIELFDIPISNTLSLSSTEEEENAAADLKDVSKDSDSDVENYLFLKYRSDLVFTGSTSFKWFKDETLSNQLFTDVLFDKDSNFSSSKENKLKRNFNEKFDRMRSLKDDLLQKTSHRLKRLNECMNEIQNLFGVEKQECKFHNVKWHAIENPNNVLTISEEEIPSELLENENNSNTVKENTNRGISKDCVSFRENKLQEMMDGVLEIRWEDEIKQEVPKPICMLTKNPSSYDDSDTEAVQIYEQKVKKLETDRQKYRRILEKEIQELNDNIKIDVESFDTKMEKLALEKIKIKSAILQEFLLRLKDRKSRVPKILERHQQTEEILSDLERDNESLSNEMSKVEQMVQELKSKYEILNKRDKLLESKFRNEFSEVNQPLVEHLSRQYKRRPKIGQITCGSLTYLVETNKCLMTGKKSIVVPQEYLEFLRGMDALDVMPSSLPPQIDVIMWQSLCKLRRNKLDVEIKLRIAALELSEAEQTFVYLQKLISSIQSRIYFTKSNAEEEIQRSSRSTSNPEIQLVLKIAQIEIHTTGYPSDFENSTIVTYDHLRQVNGEILKAGHEKVSALRKLMNLRKAMLFKSWEYKCMLKKIEHCKGHLYTVQKTKVGKEMQNDLRKSASKRKHHKDASSCDKMLKSVKKKFERMLNEEKTGLLRLIIEVKHWSKLNSELLMRLELLSAKKEEQTFILREDHLRKVNRIFHKNHMRSIMERNRLVEEVKKSQNELMNLQNQLELLKLKTYPTLRFKNVNFDFASYKRNNCVS